MNKNNYKQLVEKYTPKMGARFETYALVRIRGNIIDKVRCYSIMRIN